MRLLAFEGVINRPSIEHVVAELRKANAPDGLYVNSPGGQFEFFSVLGPVISRRGIVTLSDDVRSAAVILSLLGHRRYALPNATFFFHEVRTLVHGGAITVCDIEHVLEVQEQMSGQRREAFEEWLRQMRMAQGWFLEFLADVTQIPRSTFLDLMRQEATLSAQEALRYGVVHEVLPAAILEAVE